MTYIKIIGSDYEYKNIVELKKDITSKLKQCLKNMNVIYFYDYDSLNEVVIENEKQINEILNGEGINSYLKENQHSKILETNIIYNENENLVVFNYSGIGMLEVFDDGITIVSKKDLNSILNFGDQEKLEKSNNNNSFAR